MDGINAVKKAYESLQYRKSFIREQLRKDRDKLTGAKDKYDLYFQAVQVTETAGKLVQESVSKRLGEIATAAVQIYPVPYDKVRIDIAGQLKLKGIQASVVFERNGKEFIPILPNGQFMVGGAIAEMAAFGLRVALWNTIHPKVRNVFLLDEPFRFQNAEMRAMCMGICKQLAEKFSLQIIMVTQHTDIVSMAEHEIEIRKAGV